MSTKEEREKIAARLDKVSELLGLFPVKPRGKLPSRAWAAGRVNELTKSGTLAGIELAIRELEEAASQANYEALCETQLRTKPQISKVFVSDVSGEGYQDVERVLNNLQVYFRDGVGNRAKIERLSEFARFFTQFKSDGIPIPTKGLSTLHLQSEQFCYALFDARFLVNAKLAKLEEPIKELQKAIQSGNDQLIKEKRTLLHAELQTASKGDCGRIYRAAKHTFQEAANLLT